MRCLMEKCIVLVNACHRKASFIADLGGNSDENNDYRILWSISNLGKNQHLLGMGISKHINSNRH